MKMMKSLHKNHNYNFLPLSIDTFHFLLIIAFQITLIENHVHLLQQSALEEEAVRVQRVVRLGDVSETAPPLHHNRDL